MMTLESQKRAYYIGRMRELQKDYIFSSYEISTITCSVFLSCVWAVWGYSEVKVKGGDTATHMLTIKDIA